MVETAAKSIIHSVPSFQMVITIRDKFEFSCMEYFDLLLECYWFALSLKTLLLTTSRCMVQPFTVYISRIYFYFNLLTHLVFHFVISNSVISNLLDVLQKFTGAYMYLEFSLSRTFFTLISIRVEKSNHKDLPSILESICRKHKARGTGFCPRVPVHKNR